MKICWGYHSCPIFIQARLSTNFAFVWRICSTFFSKDTLGCDIVETEAPTSKTEGGETFWSPAGDQLEAKRKRKICLGGSYWPMKWAKTQVMKRLSEYFTPDLVEMVLLFVCTRTKFGLTQGKRQPFWKDFRSTVGEEPGGLVPKWHMGNPKYLQKFGWCCWSPMEASPEHPHSVILSRLPQQHLPEDC